MISVEKYEVIVLEIWKAYIIWANSEGVMILRGLCILWYFSHQEIGSVFFTPLEIEWSLSLPQPKEYNGSNTVWLPRVGLQRGRKLPLCSLGTLTFAVLRCPLRSLTTPRLTCWRYHVETLREGGRKGGKNDHWSPDILAPAIDWIFPAQGRPSVWMKKPSQWL